MAKLFDGKCDNPSCDLNGEVQKDIWGDCIDHDSQRIIGSACECCAQEVKRVMSGIQFIDRTGGSVSKSSNTRPEFSDGRFYVRVPIPSDCSTPEVGDTIIHRQKKVSPDGEVTQNVRIGIIEKITEVPGKNEMN